MLCTKQNIERLIASFVNHLHMTLDTARSIVILGTSKKKDAESITHVMDALRLPTTGSIHALPENNAKSVQNVHHFNIHARSDIKNYCEKKKKGKRPQ